MEYNNNYVTIIIFIVSFFFIYIILFIIIKFFNNPSSLESNNKNGCDDKPIITKHSKVKTKTKQIYYKKVKQENTIKTPSVSHVLVS